MITITIPVINGFHLEEVLNSISLQTFTDYEVVVINDSNDKTVSSLIKKYGGRELISNGSLLKARYIGANNAKGDYILQLDETRIIMDNTLLAKLMEIKADAIYISEIEEGKSFLSRAANIDKNLLITAGNVKSGSPSVLPRFYRTDILRKSMEILKNNLGENFDKITAPEDLLIFTEAKNFIENTYLLCNSKISHYGDDSLKKVVAKYYRYGKDFSKLQTTKYSNLVRGRGIERIRSRIKNVNSYNDFLMVSILLLIRGISTELGKTKGKHQKR